MSSQVRQYASDIVGARKATILNAMGEATSFGAVLDQQNSTVKRTLVVFIRHFFCGNCQEYVRRLTTDLAPSTIPEDLSVIIVGCGAASLISSYLEITQCPFPLYADPSTQLYKLLGMQKSFSLGPRGPEYIQHSLASGVVKSIVQGLKRIPSGDFAKAGDLSVNGGEFLFERKGGESEWFIPWSHCMMNSRDHTEIGVLRYRLGFSNESCASTADSNVSEHMAASVDSLTCQRGLSCDGVSDTVRKSTSIRRRSWMIKTGYLNRSSSIRRSIIHVS